MSQREAGMMLVYHGPDVVDPRHQTVDDFRQELLSIAPLLNKRHFRVARELVEKRPYLLSLCPQIQLWRVVALSLKLRRGKQYCMQYSLENQKDLKLQSTALFLDRSLGTMSSRLARCFSTNIRCASGGRDPKT